MIDKKDIWTLIYADFLDCFYDRAYTYNCEF